MVHAWYLVAVSVATPTWISSYGTRVYMSMHPLYGNYTITTTIWYILWRILATIHATDNKECDKCLYVSLTHACIPISNVCIHTCGFASTVCMSYAWTA